ncbi:MAG: pimeloyl-ACP methyl ester carboxylesterase [Candidatus Azotimanducaceae bacterium]|jgi:pimeloyl-ACP methyl ester carboxylesterase
MAQTIRLFFLTFSYLIVATVHATDAAKEQRWAGEVVDYLIEGEAVWLDDNGREFLSIYTESELESDKAIIVVHGTGIHPNWEQVVQPVRVEMTTHGWNTLSIQMPILANEAEYRDYVAMYPEVPGRFKAAEAYLQGLGIGEIVIVAHSQGATMSSYYLSRNEHPIKAFVAIGMGATQKDSHVNSAEALKNITIPVLDIYGSEDLEGVLQTVEARRNGASHNEAYKQVVTDGSDHFYVGHEEQLVNSISNWLESL